VSCDAVVLVGLLVMVSIALQIWAMWPAAESADLEVANPIGFVEYDMEDHWDDEPPEEVP